MRSAKATALMVLAGIFFLPEVGMADDFFDHILGGSVTVETEHGDFTVVWDRGGGYYGSRSRYSGYGYNRRRTGRSPYTGAPEPTYGGRRGHYDDAYGGRRRGYTRCGNSPYTGAPEPAYHAVASQPPAQAVRELPRQVKRELALRKVLAQLDSREKSKRMAALCLLTRFSLTGKDREALERLEELLEEDPEEQVRMQAVNVLAQITSERSISTLKAASEDPSTRVRRSAARAQEKVKEALLQKKIAGLVMKLESDDKEKRLDALGDMGEIPVSVSKQLVLSAAREDPASEVREKAVRKLGDLLEKNSPEISDLKKISREDPSEDVREEAKEVIEDLRD